MMTRATDGKEVSATDFKGKVTLLYFGYTFCPDVCPTTLLNLTIVLKKLGPEADDVRVLFVTVDPNRDTLDVLKQYMQAFAPQTVGLRGSPDQIAALAKRYRVAYSVKPATKGHPYEVTHSSAVYAFDRNGEVRLLVSGLATTNPDLDGFADDLRTLLKQSDHLSVWQQNPEHTLDSKPSTRRLFGIGTTHRKISCDGSAIGKLQCDGQAAPRRQLRVG